MRTLLRVTAISAVALAALMLPSLQPGRLPPARADDPPPPPIEGTRQDCVDFQIDILSGFITDVLELGILDDLGVFDIDEEVFQADLPDEGWVWVNDADRFKEVEGVVIDSHQAATDHPATHDSHDQDATISVDEEYGGLRARLNPPGEIRMEWETGTFPNEDGRDEPERFFPRWAWPVAGDRVWAEGNWVLDCGHATEIDGADHFESEIHPPRAIASMREQVHTLPGSGTTEVPVTATDLYIHGRSGYVVEILTHGQEILIDDGFQSPHDVNDHATTPIDANFEFEVCLPPQPSAGAVPAYSFEDGPENNISIDPDLTIQDATGPCAATGPKELLVGVPLAGSGVSPGQVYARKIYAGWVYPADSLRHFIVKLDQMDLHDDHEVELSLGGDCECTFFYVDLDKSSDEWFRLADWWEETCNISVHIPFDGDVCIDHNQLYDYDSDELLGNGLLDFSGPTWDFLVANGRPFNIHSNGYDQDCADSLFGFPFAPHHWNALEYALCYYLPVLTTFEKGADDGFASVNACFVESDTSLCDPEAQQVTGYGLGFQDLSADGEYEMEFTVSEGSVAEDDADLAVTKECAHDGEVALAGEPFTCTITVTNAGPGLPKNVVLDDTLSTIPASVDYSISTPTYTVAFGTETGETQDCTVTPPGEFSCAIGSVPVGGSATVEVEVTPTEPGTFENEASVSSDTTDPDTGNNSDEESVQVFLPVQIDIRPGGVPNSVNVSANGEVAVAILNTPDFNPAVVDFRTVCFGDAEEPAQRDCTEKHGQAHFIDVDKDRDKDMVLHYEVVQTGIDLGDTRACLIGMTHSGIGIYGCDSVRTL